MLKELARFLKEEYDDPSTIETIIKDIERDIKKEEPIGIAYTTQGDDETMEIQAFIDVKKCEIAQKTTKGDFEYIHVFESYYDLKELFEDIENHLEFSYLVGFYAEDAYRDYREKELMDGLTEVYGDDFVLSYRPYVDYSDYLDQSMFDQYSELFYPGLDPDDREYSIDDITMNFNSYYDLEIDNEFIKSILSEYLEKYPQTFDDDDYEFLCDVIPERVNVEYLEALLNNSIYELQIMVDYDNLDTEGFGLYEELEDVYQKDRELSSYPHIEKILKLQGYELDDLLDEEKIENSKFLNSLNREIINVINSSAVFTVVLKINGEELFDFLSREKTEIEIHPHKNNYAAGLFAPPVGGGSLMGVRFEKPFSIDLEDCILGFSSLSFFGYSVDEVYGELMLSNN